MGDSQQEARLRLPEAVAYTEQVIADLKAGRKPQERPKTISNRITHDLSRELLVGRPGLEIYEDHSFTGTPEEAIALSELPEVPRLSALPIRPVDLIETAKERKPRISLATVHEWERSLKLFAEFLGHENFHLVQKSDARAFRTHLLKTNKVSTVKSRLGYVAGLFNASLKSDKIETNPFLNITDGLDAGRGGDEEEKETYDIKWADDTYLDQLPELDCDLYWLLRWTGCRIAEIAGIKSKDIRLDEGLINITPYITNEPFPRPLKNKYSRRVVPIHPQIQDTLERLVKTSERPFEQFFRPKTQRWMSHVVWSTKIGLHPHALRHNMITCLRNKGVEEYLIGRLAGHRVAGMTASYGSVAPEVLKEAMLKLE